MKLATWNLERLPSAPRRERVSQWIAGVDADVWVLTETRPEFAPGREFSGVVSQRPDEPDRAHEVWSAIWSRFPIEPLPTTSDPARSVAALVHPPEGAPLVIYATVLPWLSSGWRGARGSDAFLAALGAQAADWRALAQRYPGAALCVAGDLNQDLSDRHFYGSGSGRSALRDALATAGLRALTAHPHDPVRRISPSRASVDHICVPERASLWAAPALEVWPPQNAPDRALSDHFGVAVTASSK